VANTIQRLRYFDGEYLRSNDFTAEQAYHLEMRRRLNLKLHLHGIVSGLSIVKDQDSVPGAEFYSLSAGFAIDAQGREIVVSQPYSLSTDNVLSQQGLTAGPNEIWICYREAASDLPEAGFMQCNAQGQNTRWTEGFQVLLVASPEPSKLTAALNPHALGGIRLGTVTLSNASGWQITKIANDFRTYVGIVAQSVVGPDKRSDTFNVAIDNIGTPVAAPPGYVDIHPSTFTRGNAFLQKNAVVGKDFLLDTTLKGQKLPSTFQKTGNLKVAQDFFLQGGFYGFLDGTWLDLKTYIQSLTPDVQVGSIQIQVPIPAVPPPPPGTLTGTTPPTTVTSSLASAATLKSVFFLQGVQIDSALPFPIYWPGGVSDPLNVGIDGSASLTQPNTASLIVNWSTQYKVAVPTSITLTVGYMIVFTATP
jgi:hypothetical protein